jgi:FtsH-binding integral membrane protein
MEETKTLKKSESAVAFNNYLAGIFAWMFAGLAVSGVIGWLISTSQETVQAIFLNPISFLVLIVIQFGLVIYLSARITKLSTNAARGLFLAYAASIGVTLSVIFLAYSSTSITRVFFITAAMFLIMAGIGYVTKIDLSKFGAILLMGLIGIIIATLVNLFIKSNTLQLVISYIGVVIFLGLTAYDIQKIKKIYAAFGEAGNMAILGALSLYLDFLNLFLFLLRIFGAGRD